MDVVHLLPDSVANQIAAGEVIQRPASVVKELVENAVDAGATHVQVLITDAGKTCIQVIDNGKGMSETDARMSFERHATSKISNANDLFALKTMGFRGEALASIAAVAQVELRTRKPEDELGTAIHIEGSRVTSQETVACPVGANFIVQNLFYNIPARRKFLKSNHTEWANILAEFERLTLAHPQVKFTLKHNEQTMLQLPAANFRQRILGLFGKRLDQQLLPIHAETEIVRLTGFVGTPDSSKKKGAHQFFIANERFMRHPYFAKAVQSAYERLIPEGEQVPFFIKMDIDPGEIDVNIHPTKTEIKFTEEQSIWQILLAAVRETLGKHNGVPAIDFDTANRPDIPVFADGPKYVAAPKLQLDLAYNPFGKPGPDAAEHQSQPLFQNQPEEEVQAWSQMTVDCLQFRGRFIVMPGEQGLMIIDQHRASERVRYDRYRQMLSGGTSATQGLLFPEMVQLSPSQVAVLEKIEADVNKIGFNISNLGGGSFSILGVPAGTEGLKADELMLSIIDNAMTTALDVEDEVTHAIAMTLAKKTALTVGEYLSADEMNALVNDLLKSSNPNLTADGRLIVHWLTNESLERQFC